MFNEIACKSELCKPPDRDPTIEVLEAENHTKHFHKRHGLAPLPSLDSKDSESKLETSARIIEASKKK